MAKHRVVNLGTVDAAVLSRLGDGQPRANTNASFTARQRTKGFRTYDPSADRRELALPVLCGSLHDALRSAVIDPRSLGGGIDRRRRRTQPT